MALESEEARQGPASGPRRVEMSEVGRRGRELASRLVDYVEETSTGRLFLLWLGLIGVCAAFYSLFCAAPGHGLVSGGTPVTPGLDGFGTAIYFSFVTATSLGFGDVVPLGASRALAVFEAATELLVFGAVVSKFVSSRQEKLVAEIHRLTFEDRLSRVQSNLHMTLSEFQAIAAACSTSASPAPGLQSRVSSAAMVFAAELRTIHDLLYGRQEDPPELVLEPILVGLAASMRELGELLTCAEGKVDRPPILEASLERIASLALGICGECVPRTYAPALKLWMDEIQSGARALGPSGRVPALSPGS